MIKIVGIIFLVISGTTIGYLISYKHRSHIDFLRSYIKFILDLKIEINYKHEPLTRILENYNPREYLSAFITKCIELSKSRPFNLAWSMAFSNLNAKFGISFEEEKIIKSFASQLGQTDVESQLEYLDYNISALKPYLDRAIENRKKNEKLPIILGLCISLIISAVII